MPAAPTSSRSGANPILSASVTLTVAQILALHTTPITVVSPIGTSSAVAPVAVVSRALSGSTPYVLAGGISLDLQGAGTAALNVMAAGLGDAGLSRTLDVVAPSGNYGTTSDVNLATAPIAISADTADPTDGNRIVRVTVYYYVVSFAA